MNEHSKNLNDKSTTANQQNKFLVSNDKLIPKHRFDCINIALKEYKEKYIELQNKINNLEKINNELMSLINKKLKVEQENYILQHLLKSQVINYAYVRSLLKIERLSFSTVKKVLNKRLKELKQNKPYLFYTETASFMIVPFKKNN